jgi:TonB family protein
MLLVINFQITKVTAPIARTINFTFALCVWISLSALGYACLRHASTPEACVPPVRVAVLDFGESPTGKRAAEKVREALTTDKLSVDNGLVVIDRNLALAAALGNGYQGSLNLTTQEARDIGAAIGCDFFIIGNAETVKRSPSNAEDYFESYAVMFIVSARTGQLVSWQRPAERRDTPTEAEKALLNTAISATTNQFRVSILRAFEDEAAARAAAVETPPAAVEIMSDDEDKKTDAREPRPYRRLKPPYPEAAARSEVEAVVDVLVDIDARGEVGKIEIARWAGYGLEQSVVDTVRQMHFFPAMREGVAIPMRVLLRYNFRHTTPDKAPIKTLIIPRPKV